jgi:hypothetical protein
METLYNVYFTGELLQGHDPALVREKLARLFNADQQTLDLLFSGKTQLIKRDCDRDTALQYQQAMERAGAQPVIRASQQAGTEAPLAKSKLSAAEKIAALAAAPDAGDYDADSPQPSSGDQLGAAAPGTMNLAPAGADVLREDERPEQAARPPDTSGLDACDPGQRLSVEAPAPPTAPDTSHLIMGEVGDDIPGLPPKDAPLHPNTDALDLAPQGTDFADCAALPAEAPALDLAGINLAPPETEVLEEQYRKKIEAEAPDTEHISLQRN